MFRREISFFLEKLRNIMSQHLTLAASKRDGAGTQIAKKLRAQGIVPAVVYGGQQDNYPIQVDAIAFRDVLKASASEHVLVNLQISGAKEKDKLALIQHVQHHPITGKVIHIDFNAVNEDQEIHSKVPVELHGDPIGVSHGGLLEQMIYEFEVKCLPKDLPEMIKAEVSGLDVGDALHVSDIVFPEGVAAGVDGEVVVALVSDPCRSI
jgi:large subunit ribosomal protein L25